MQALPAAAYRGQRDFERPFRVKRAVARAGNGDKTKGVLGSDRYRLPVTIEDVNPAA